MPRRRRACNVARRAEKAKRIFLEVLPNVLKYVDQPTLLLGVRCTSSEWASRVPAFDILALRSNASTHVAIHRTQATRIAALQGLLRVFCSAPHCDSLRVVDVATVANQWGQHDPWCGGHCDGQPDPWIERKTCLEPLVACYNLEYIALTIEEGGLVLPVLLRMPKLRFARLHGTGYGDIGGDSELPDDVCEAIAASRLRTLHLRYASWPGKRLVLPSTLRELVVESFPWDDNFGCRDGDADVPGDVVLGGARLQLLALSMSCVQPEKLPPGPSPIPEKPDFYARYGCWDSALLRSFRSCGSLQRVVVPRDAMCVTDDGATALQLALATASQREMLHSWILLGLQLQRLQPCLHLQQALSANMACMRLAQMPRALMRRVLEFAVTGPEVERPNVWPEIREDFAWQGFPTLAANCSVAADFHVHNAFHIGENNRAKDSLVEREWHRQY